MFLRGCPIECDEYFKRFFFACRRYINNGIAGKRDIMARILHIVDKQSNFNLHAISSWLLYFSLPFQYNLAAIGVLEFMVVIDVYAQPTREKIKFYRTASYSFTGVSSPPVLRQHMVSKLIFKYYMLF